MKKKLLKLISLAQVIAILVVSLSTNVFATTTSSGMWVKGDFHTHSYLSDGSYTPAEVAAKAKQFGLDWYSATDHGGATKGTRNENGVLWADVTNKPSELLNNIMPRWASIFGIGQDLIDQNRKSIMQFSGFEWNVPTHEHSSVGLVGLSNEVKKELSIYDYAFDSDAEIFNATNTNFANYQTITEKTIALQAGSTVIKYMNGRQMDGKFEAFLDPADNKWKTSVPTSYSSADQTAIKANLSSKKLNNTHGGALEGARFLQNNFGTKAYFLPNHPSRKLAYTAADFKEFYDLAPDVFFGAELLPGHQASAYRGGLGYIHAYDTVLKKNVDITSKTGETIEAKIDSYIAGLATTEQPKYTAELKADMITKTKANVAKQRTYGGADYMLSKVGGVWDTMLTEGRKFWIFGNSDFHIDSEKSKTIVGSEPDFWPGEYSKNYTYVNDKSYQSILDGMRSGNSFTALGDLINALDYKISNNTTSATMGQTLNQLSGKTTNVTIRFKSPEMNNNGQKPVVDHIDLIAGEVKGEPSVKYVDSSKTIITNFEDPKQYLTAEYQNDDVSSTTKVIRTFNKSEFKVDSEGYLTVSFELPASDKNMYYRLRGTNNVIGSKDVDVNGNPTIDTPIEIVTGDNTVEKAYSDLWFYSNPIYVNAQTDGVTINGIIKDKNGNVLKNTKLELNSTPIYTTTDENGQFTFNNVEMGIHTINVLDANGDVVSELTFNVQRGEKTEFNAGDIWVANGVSNISIEYSVDGGNISIKNVSEIVPEKVNATTVLNANVNNPKTGDNSNVLPIIIFLLASAGIFALAIGYKIKKVKV